MWYSFWKSLKEYILSLGYWGWVVAIGFVSSLVGGYLDISGNANVPTWLWLILLLAVLVIAPFIVFHKLRVDRDRLQATLDSKKRRKSIADKLAEFYLSGDKLKQAIGKEDFSGDAVALHNKWASPVINYFRTTSDELGNSRLLSLVPDNRDLIALGATGLDNKEDDYVYHLWVLQLENMRKLIEEFLR